MHKKPVNLRINTSVPTLTGDYGTDTALWQLAVVLAEIARNDNLTEPAADESAGLETETSNGPSECTP
jgi:hypothetical protein